MGKNRKESYMKILKKTLAVALVLVLALGMVPVMTGAMDYTDEAEIEYKEEVAVLTGIGVLEGYDAGTFQPTRNVTRAQACAIVARLMLTRDIADSLPVDSTGFKDVPISHWAANYIAFCVSEGIVVGYGDGRFGPNNDVKGSEFAIMIMRALGIGDAKRWEGPNWQMFAILDGQGFGILTTGVNYTRPATRDETASYAFEGLLYSPSGQSVEMIYAIVRFELKEKDGVTYMEPVYDWIPVKVIAKDSIAASVYPTLKENEDDVDDLGRPGRAWVFGKPAKTIYLAAAEPVTTIKGLVTRNALFTATGKGPTGTTGVPVDAIVNQAGGQDDAATLTSLRNSNANANPNIYAPANTGNDPANGGSAGLGNITEIYKVGTEYLAVVIVPSFGKITDITSKPAAGGIGARTIYTLDDGSSGMIFTDPGPYDADDLVIDGTVKKGDWVIYYEGSENLYISAPDTLTGVLSAVTSAGVYTIGGESLRLAQAYRNVDGPPLAKTAEQTFYVDAQKNILGVAEKAGTAVQIVFVFGIDSYSILEGGKIITKYFADVIDLAGKVSTVEIAYADGKNTEDFGYWFLNTKSGTDYPNLGVPYLYSVGPGGVYTFDKITGTTHVASEVTAITKGSIDLTTTGFVKNVNNSTILAFVNFEDGDPDGTVTLYNRTTVPTFTDLKKTWAVSIGDENKTPVEAANGIANIVYIFDNVFGAESSSLVYLLGSFTAVAGARIYDMVVKGEVVTLTVPSGGVSDHEDAIAEGVLFMSVGVDSTGKVVYGATIEDYLDDKPTGSFKNDIVACYDSIEYDDGILILDGTTKRAIDDDIPVYLFEIEDDPGDPDFDTIDLDEVDFNFAELIDEEEIEDGVAYVVYSDGTKTEIVAIYILIYY